MSPYSCNIRLLVWKRHWHVSFKPSLENMCGPEPSTISISHHIYTDAGKLMLVPRCLWVVQFFDMAGAVTFQSLWQWWCLLAFQKHCCQLAVVTSSFALSRYLGFCPPAQVKVSRFKRDFPHTFMHTHTHMHTPRRTHFWTHTHRLTR